VEALFGLHVVLVDLGDDTDFERIMIHMNRESNDRVTAENCLAILRLARAS
jgi:hypothetical protein